MPHLNTPFAFNKKSSIMLLCKTLCEMYMVVTVDVPEFVVQAVMAESAQLPGGPLSREQLAEFLSHDLLAVYTAAINADRIS